MREIFKWLLDISGDRASIYAQWFVRTFSPELFEDIDRLFYCFIRYCVELGIVPSQRALEPYLKYDAKRDIKKYNIKVNTMDSYDYREASQLEEACAIIRKAAVQTFAEYTAVDLSNHEFKIDMSNFMSELKKTKIVEVMGSSFKRLTDGSDIDDVALETVDKLNLVKRTLNTKLISRIDASNNSDDTDNRFIAPTNIPCIDGGLGGIYSRLIYTLTSQPGGGKTRLSAVHFCYNVLTVAKEDVLVYELELTKSQFRNILIAYHITKLYGGAYKIPDSLMNKRDGLSDEMKQIYEAAKIDLFESGKFGKLTVIETVNVEELEDDILSYARVSSSENSNLSLVVIDYMGLVRSRPVDRYSKFSSAYEIITESYDICRRCSKVIDTAFLCVNQFNDQGVDAAYAGKPIRSGYVQGGHCINRYSDFDMNLTFTEEQRLAGVRMFSNGKARGVAEFAPVLFATDLSVSIFKQESILT